MRDALQQRERSDIHSLLNCHSARIRRFREELALKDHLIVRSRISLENELSRFIDRFVEFCESGIIEFTQGVHRSD